MRPPCSRSLLVQLNARCACRSEKQTFGIEPTSIEQLESVRWQVTAGGEGLSILGGAFVPEEKRRRCCGVVLCAAASVLLLCVAALTAIFLLKVCEAATTALQCACSRQSSTCECAAAVLLSMLHDIRNVLIQLATVICGHEVLARHAMPCHASCADVRRCAAVHIGL